MVFQPSNIRKFLFVFSIVIFFMPEGGCIPVKIVQAASDWNAACVSSP